MIGMVASTLIYYRVEAFKKYFQSKELLILSLFFWIAFLSGVYSDDKSYWLNWVRIRIPFLVLPLAFAPLKKLDDKKLILILYSFILTLLISTTAVLINYRLHYDAINDSFTRGGTIPMPYSHIRYTLMLAFSFFCSIYLFEKKYFLFNKNEKWLQVTCAAFAFIALHVLLVRSGLLALYLGLAYIALRGLTRRKKPVRSALIIALLIATPFIAFRSIPGLQNKLEYIRYDLEQYQKGDINEYSDAMRILSMKMGVELWQKNLWLGVGPGDLKIEMDKIYAADYPQISEANRRLPHNQFIWALATTGIVGFTLFLFAFFYPLIIMRHYRHWLLLVLYIVIFSSFFTEDTFEEQIGAGFYIIFLLLLLNHLKHDE